jgi:hypothetical protein
LNESLLALLREIVHERTIYDHLLGEAGINARLFVSVQVFLIKSFDTVIKALACGVEKVLGARLEVDEVVTFHFVFYIISRAPVQLILAGRSLLLINVDQNCCKHRQHGA